MKFLSSLLEGCICKLNEIGTVVSEKKSFETVYDGRRRLSSYKLPRSPWLGGAKKLIENEVQFFKGKLEQIPFSKS